MATYPAKIKSTIEKYLTALRQNNIPIQEAILFGSYANDTYHEWSDIDIALVSEIFQGNFMDDKDKIRRITLGVSSAIEVLPFSPKEFEQSNPLVREIMKTGIKLT